MVALTVPGSNIIKVKYCGHCLSGLWFVKGDANLGEKLAQAQKRGLGSETNFCHHLTVGKLLPLSELDKFPFPRHIHLKAFRID